MKSGRRFTFIPFWIVLFLGAHKSIGQSPLFRQYELREGRLKPRILCMTTDPSGVLWLGTEAGLFYFNGIDFKRPYLADSVRSQAVTALAHDKEGHLWVGTASGSILLLDHYQQEFFMPEEGFPKVAISGIAQAKDGTLYFGTQGEGIYYWSGRRLYNADTDDGLSDNYCYTLIPGPRGGVLSGTDNGISYLLADTSGKSIERIGRREGLIDDIVRVLIPAQGGYWIGFQDGGVMFIDLQLRVRASEPGYTRTVAGQVNALCMLHDELWVGTEHTGVQRFRRSERGLRLEASALAPTQDLRVSAILRDPAGNVWIGSSNKLIRSTGDNIRLLDRYAGSAMHHIHCLLRDQQGRFWFSPDQQLAVLTPTADSAQLQRIEVTRPAQLTDIVSLYEDNWGGIWIGTLGEGVFRLDPTNGKVQHLTDVPSLANASILSITGRGSDLWITGFGGVTRLRIESANGACTYAPVHDPISDTLDGVYVYTSFIDRAGKLWLGTDEQGLFRYARGRLTRFDHSRGLPGNSVLGICEDASGRLWVNCIDGGVAVLTGDSLRSFGVSDGLTDLNNTSLLALADSSLLVVHANGIDRFDPSTQTFSPLHPDELMNDLNPDANTAVLGLDGRIWLGTERGLLVLDAPTKGRARFISTVLEHVIQNPDPVRYWEKHIFAYDENNFRFEFSGVCYADPARLQYAIQLDGLSDKWQYSHEPAAWFSNLAPGSYTLRVRASLNNRFLRSPELIYHFTVTPPFWKTWWFRALLASAIVGGIWWFVRRRERELRELERLEKERIMFQLETLRSQVNPHFLFNSFNTLLNLIEKDPAKAAEYAEQLSDFFRDIVSNRDLPQVSLQDELRLLANYIAIQKKRYGDNLRVEIEADPVRSAAYLIPPMSLQLLAENAIKHNVVSRDQPLAITIRLAADELCVENNLQPRLQHEPSTGLGLENIKRRFSLMTQRPVRIERAENVFRVFLPLQSADAP